jgi:hypothetical protein
MPRQDAQGRWISDDGNLWWTGSSWERLPAKAGSRPEGSELPYLVGAGCAILLLALVLMGVCTTIVAQSPSFQATPTP